MLVLDDLAKALVCCSRFCEDLTAGLRNAKSTVDRARKVDRQSSKLRRHEAEEDNKRNSRVNFLQQ